MQVVALLVSIVVLAWATAMQPSSAQCPDGWSLATGIRRDGSYACHAPLPACCGSSTGPCEHVACPPDVVVQGRIACTGGSMPIVVDFQTVGCMRR